MKRFLYFLFVLLAFCACDNDVSSLVETEQKTSAVSYQRTPQEVLAISRSFLSQQRHTRSAEASVPTLTLSVLPTTSHRASRGVSDFVELPDTMAYVVNIGKGDGYLLVSNDKRVDDVLAYVPDGEFSLNVMKKTSPTSLFYERLNEFYKQKIETPCDTIRFDDEWEQYYQEKSDWVAESTIGRLVPVAWHQDPPFNNKAKLEKDDKSGLLVRTPSGCVATALAQLLTTYRFPKRYGDLTLDWDVLITGKPQAQFEEDVATLMRKIGDDLNNDWKPRATSAEPYLALQLFRKLGYTHVPDFQGYHNQNILKSLKRKHPVYMLGVTPIVTPTGNREDGHAWLIDGYMEQEKYIYLREKRTKRIVSARPIASRELVHCNWGWNTDNGYYLPGVFEVRGYISTDGKDSPSLDHISYNFKTNLLCAPNIHP